MKSQIRLILFALLIPACGNRETSTTFDPTAYVPHVPVPIAEPAVVEPAPKPPDLVKVADEHPLPTKYDDAMTEGKALAAKGDHARAREMFEAAAKLDKKSAEPHVELARMFIDTNERGLAIAAANKAVKLAPDSSQAWNTKGRAELNRFGYDAAIEAFTKSVELNRDNVWAWNNLGYTELQLKKYDDAVLHFVEATSRKGATGYMFNNLGTALEQLDKLDEARAAFDAGSKLGSKEAVASRKRLEGVKSIALTAKQDATKPDAKPDGFEAVKPEPVEAPKPESGEGSDAGVAKGTM